jgi:putative oxidoreductase
MTTNSAFTERGHDAGLFVLRIVTGSIFIAHGAQKLFSFGVPGVTNNFSQIGAPYPEITAPLVSALEFVGGIALVFGMLTRLVAFLLTIDMLAAIALVHLPNGFFLPNGYEYALMLAGASIGLVFAGAGAYSVDGAFSHRRRVEHVPTPTYAAPPAYTTRPPRPA